MWRNNVKEEVTLECGCVEFLVNKELQSVQNCIDHPGSVDWRGSDKKRSRQLLHKLEKQQIELEKEFYLKKVEKWEKRRDELEYEIDRRVKRTTDGLEMAELADSKMAATIVKASLKKLRIQINNLE